MATYENGLLGHPAVDVHYVSSQVSVEQVNPSLYGQSAHGSRNPTGNPLFICQILLAPVSFSNFIPLHGAIRWHGVKLPNLGGAGKIFIYSLYPRILPCSRSIHHWCCLCLPLSNHQASLSVHGACQTYQSSSQLAHQTGEKTCPPKNLQMQHFGGSIFVPYSGSSWSTPL